MIFPHKRYDEIVADTFNQVTSLSHLKGGEYAGDQDRLANFRRNGPQAGVLPEQCWAIYYNKHHDAVMQYIQDLAKGKTRPRAEKLAGRVDDMITYLILFKCFLEEHDRKPEDYVPGTSFVARDTTRLPPVSEARPLRMGPRSTSGILHERDREALDTLQNEAHRTTYPRN